MSVIYFGCGSGISGDMVVGSLLDLGVEIEYLARELSRMDLSGYSVSARKVDKRGVEATKFNVAVEGIHPRRNLPGINSLIEKSGLGRRVKDLSQGIFTDLARSEALAHSTSIENVHFHEVGAVDSIIDIVSAAILLDMLEVSEVHCGTVSLGRGRIRTEHGMMDIPAPAVRDLLKDAPTAQTDIPAELTTPTGAAILKSCVKKYKNKPPETGRIGYGAGTSDLPIPNVLRAWINP
ncbi:MAG: LarC family nickel insertion protein [Candidatus Altiarchaeia archaeon]